METKITIKNFEAILPYICDRETSQDPDNWTPENPLLGHCAVVTLVAQNLFGGKLLRASLAEIPEFARMRSHYWNELTDGTDADFTKPQFGERYPVGLKAETRDRTYLLSYPETVKRYKLLSWRLAKLLSNDNALFNDDIYRRCFYAALDSECQKMKFGCVITHDEKIVYEGYNKEIDALKSLCEPKCIRFSIQSRTESMLGACGHAEEQGLWRVVHAGIPVHECDLYIAGFYPNGLPWLKKEPEHTCLRCAVQMYYARIKTVYVPVINRWEGISTEQALETALAYATQEKKI
jgi:deoxycytidylate deaminase